MGQIGGRNRLGDQDGLQLPTPRAVDPVGRYHMVSANRCQAHSLYNFAIEMGICPFVVSGNVASLSYYKGANKLVVLSTTTGISNEQKRFQEG